VGLQMIAKRSEEGSLEGLGWIDAEVKKLTARRISARVSAAYGMNDVEPRCQECLFKDIGGRGGFISCIRTISRRRTRKRFLELRITAVDLHRAFAPETLWRAVSPRKKPSMGNPAPEEFRGVVSMLRPRITPCLLLKNGGLVKTVQFGSPKYVGDPIHAVKIFNEKEVDEIMVVDIDASVQQKTDMRSSRIWPLNAGCRCATAGASKQSSKSKEIISLGVEKGCD